MSNTIFKNDLHKNGSRKHTTAEWPGERFGGLGETVLPILTD